MPDRPIRPDEETEAAIWAEGTRYTKEDILRSYRIHLSNLDEPMCIQEFCEQALKIKNKTAGGE
jgi:hypothetical protein